MTESWIEGDSSDVALNDWVLKLKDKLLEMSELVFGQEQATKVKMKEYYDRSAIEKVFKEGDMVLVRKPGLHSKMGDSWNEPFQVARQVSRLLTV